MISGIPLIVGLGTNRALHMCVYIHNLYACYILYTCIYTNMVAGKCLLFGHLDPKGYMDPLGIKTPTVWAPRDHINRRILQTMIDVCGCFIYGHPGVDRI